MNGDIVGRYTYDAWGNHKAYTVVGSVESLAYDSTMANSSTSDALLRAYFATRSNPPNNGDTTAVSTPNKGYTSAGSTPNIGDTTVGSNLNIGDTTAGSNLNIATNSIVLLNPIRYRSYYYDHETGLFYTPGRYYDSEVGRWINADDVSVLDVTKDYIGGLNLYSYCFNNPVNSVDDGGDMPNWLKWLIGGVVIVGLAIATIATGGAAAGVAGFILAGALKGAIIGAVSGALISGTIGGISSAVAGAGFCSGFEDGAADGFMGGAIMGGITGAAGNAIKVGQAAKAWASTGKKSGFKQMTEHYTKHVINERQTAVAKNIVNYTKQASQFFAKNGATGQLLRNGIVKISGAPGGIFNVNGLIRSFWYILKQ